MHITNTSSSLYYSCSIKSCRRKDLRRQRLVTSLHLSLMPLSIATSLASSTGTSSPRTCSSRSKTSPKRSLRYLTSASLASSTKKSWRLQHAARQVTSHPKFFPKSLTKMDAISGAWPSSSSSCSQGPHLSTTRITSNSLRRLSAASTTSTRRLGHPSPRRPRTSSVSCSSPTPTSASMESRSWRIPGFLVNTRLRIRIRTF